MIRVNAGLFRACLPFVSAREDRVHISGVLVEPHPKGGVILVATDGHRMLVVHDEAGQADHPAMIAWGGRNSALKAPAAFRRWINVQGYTGHKAPGKLVDGDASITVTEAAEKAAEGDPERLVKEPAGASLIGGMSVMWRKVIPTSVPRVVPAAFSGPYLTDFAKAGAELGALSWRGTPAMAMTVLAPDASSAAVILWPDLEGAFGVLMPMHIPLPAGLPAFMAAAPRSDQPLTRASDAGGDRETIAAPPPVPASREAGEIANPPLADQAKHHGRDWKVWWQVSGERGDHIMEVTQSGLGYARELAWIGDQHHDQAGALVAEHNEQVRRLREVIARQAAAKALLQTELGRIKAVIPASLSYEVPDAAEAIASTFREYVKVAAEATALRKAVTPKPEPETGGELAQRIAHVLYTHNYIEALWQPDPTAPYEGAVRWSDQAALAIANGIISRCALSASSPPAVAGGADRDEIARIIALHGLGRVDGGDRRALPNASWAQEEWERRILECIPCQVEKRCYALADQILALTPRPAEPGRPECIATDNLVDRMSTALKAKLLASETKYGWQNGWLKADWQVDCQRDLARHVSKGDPLDVAAYAAFCWHHGWATAQLPYQTRVAAWVAEVAKDDPFDAAEHRDRFAEEALELVQSLGQTAEGAHQLVDYVFGRPIGEPHQELGGTMVTLAKLATSAGLDMVDAGDAELTRCWQPEVIAKIRRKRANRHGRGPLPGNDADLVTGAQAQNPDLGADVGWASIERDEKRIADFIVDRFGLNSLNNPAEHLDRLLEEAIEVQQAIYHVCATAEAGRERAVSLIEHVHGKEPGDPLQEMGGVMTCALALGRLLRIRLDHAAQAELTRIEGLSKAHFDARHQAKVDAGVAAQHDRPDPALRTLQSTDAPIPESGEGRS